MLDDYTRAHVNRAIEDALRPRGMSTHSGKVSIDVGTLQRLIVMIDRGAEALLDAQKRIPLRLPEPMTDAEIMELYRAVPKGYLSRDGHAGIRLARSVEAEVLRRVRERNAAPAPSVQQDDEALELLRQAAHALDEAADSIADWASYASDYFREKHDYEGDLKRTRDAAAHFRAMLAKRGAA